MKPVSLLALDDEFVGLRNVNGLAYAKPDQLSTIVNRLAAFRTYSFTTSICLSSTEQSNNGWKDRMPLKTALEATINFGSVLDSVNTHNFLRMINPVKNSPVTYPQFA
jgi:hypothetical protein